MKRAAALLALLAALAAVWRPATGLDRKAALQAAAAYRARIVRDAWGVPHIFGRRDADVAYGLAWAHAEDDFATIQGALLAARGRLATWLGAAGAPNDYMVGLLRVRDTVEAGWERLEPRTRALCEAYADGLNHYAALHEDEALPGLYPARGQDVIAGFVHKVPLFFGIDRVLRDLLAPEQPEPPRTLHGSNVFVVAPRRSADGVTRLAINSHQPWDGPVAWYEARLKSEEGWDAAGGLFPGAPVLLHGHNRALGWAHTVNQPDLLDVFQLDVDPVNPDRYRFDGQWRSLEKRPVAIQVKLLGPFHWTFTREALWSVHGPVVRGSRGTFALRYAGMDEARHLEQWYRMNRARDFDEWRDAMRMLALPMFNTGYADARGRSYYVYNARLPLRAPGYDWTRPVPGNTSRTLWTAALPYDALPQVIDPPSGFLQNCNSSPFETTDGPGNPDAAGFDPAFGIETHMTNRALRAHETFGADREIDDADFLRYKFDRNYSDRSALVRAVDAVLAGPWPRDPVLREVRGVLARWLHGSEAQDRSAALVLLTFAPHHDGRLALGPDPLSRLRETATALRRDFGRVDPQWGEVLRLRRGRLDLALGGAPDVANAIYHRPARDGRREAYSGDSYVSIVSWDREGRVRSRSLQPYGSAVRDPRSRHHADQAALFAERRLKEVPFEEQALRAEATASYAPGQQRSPLQ